MQKTLDLSIKKSETGTTKDGYSVNNGKSYEAYVSNQEWEMFVKDMEQNHPDAFDEYMAGSGGEMKQKGKYPPKMASYGSSSRMIYNLCKDIPKFHYEHQLPTKVGGIANLDGFIEKEDRYIFVEAKCREPYGAKSHIIEKKYRDLYQYIDSDGSCNLNIRTENIDSKISVMFSVGKRIITNFDIKQMICHLLGIAVKFLNNPTDKRISFLYLCYNPKLIEIIDDKKKANIYETYDQMSAECHAIDFSNLFKSIVMYLSEQLKVGMSTSEDIHKMLDNFKFQLCDQNDYINKIIT